MKSNHWITFLIALLILIVIGTIVGTGIVRWREIKVLIKENDDVKYLREVIHEVFMGTMELSIYSESVVNWDENDVELYHEKRMRTDYAICKMMPYYPKNKIDSVRQKLAEKEELLYHISSLVAQKDLGAPSRKPSQALRRWRRRCAPSSIPRPSISSCPSRSTRTVCANAGSTSPNFSRRRWRDGSTDGWTPVPSSGDATRNTRRAAAARPAARISMRPSRFAVPNSCAVAPRF